jgi:hypothetical protein
MADHFDSKKFGSVVAIPFYVTDAATSQTDTDITLNQGDLAVMPTSGSVVGIAGRSTEASTGTGSIVFRAHNGGTEIANVGYPSITMTSGLNTSYASCAPGVCTFDAGDALGISYTSGAAYTPATCDYDVLLYVVLDPS